MLRGKVPQQAPGSPGAVAEPVFLRPGVGGLRVEVSDVHLVQDTKTERPACDCAEGRC